MFDAIRFRANGVVSGESQAWVKQSNPGAAKRLAWPPVAGTGNGDFGAVSPFLESRHGNTSDLVQILGD